MCAYLYLLAIISMIAGASCTADVKCPASKQPKLVSGGSKFECETCPVGFFKAATSNDKCTEHTRCPAGKFTETSGSAQSQPICKVCAAGFFKAQMDHSSVCFGQHPGQLNQRAYFES